MNIFKTIEENFEHGGITVELQAAQSILSLNSVLPVGITVTNTSKEVRIIKSVSTEIQAIEDANGYTLSLNNTIQTGNTTDDNKMYNMQTVIIAKVDSNETILLQPNQGKAMTLNLTIDAAAFAQAATMHVKNKYELHATVDVEGITLDPRAHQVLTILS